MTPPSRGNLVELCSYLGGSWYIYSSNEELTRRAVQRRVSVHLGREEKSSETFFYS